MERQLLDVRTLPVGKSYKEEVAEVAAFAAMFGPFTRLVFDKTAPRGVVERAIIDARRRKMLANAPLGVTITPGEGISWGDEGLSAGNIEVLKTLQEAIRTDTLKTNPALKGVGDLIRAALNTKLDISTANRLTFSERDARVFALALAVHPKFAPKAGMRYRDPTGRYWADFETAVGALGQRATEFYVERRPEIVMSESYDVPIEA
ncbi:MAG TPA: hypothetical protein VID26_01340 [Candidatus Limnocylindrales bacterium]